MTLQEMYEEYRQRCYAEYQEAKSFEAFAEDIAREVKEEAERKAAEAEIQVDTYKAFVERAKEIDDRDDAYMLVKEMRRVHDDECQRLYALGDKVSIGAHINAFKAAEKTIMSPYSKPRKPRKPIIATNVYDDDDNPTTHILY